MSRARAMSSGPARPSGLPRASLRQALRRSATNLSGCLVLNDTLAAGIVGGVEVTQLLFEFLMGVDGDAQHLAADPAIKTLDHAVRLRAAGLGGSVLSAEGRCKAGHEVTAVVGQHMVEAEGKGGGRFSEEGKGAALGLIVLDGQVDWA